MTKREIAVVACRILAIVTSVRAIEASSYALNYLSSIMLNPSSPNGTTMSPPPFFISLLLLQFSPLALLFVFALFLWAQADFISAKMVGEQDKSMVPVAVNADTQRLAFSVLGCYLLTQALPQIAQGIATFLTANDPDFDWTKSGAPDVTFTIVQLSLGLWLLFGARGIVGLLANIRHIGREPQSQETDAEEIPLRPEK